MERSENWDMSECCVLVGFFCCLEEGKPSCLTAFLWGCLSLVVPGTSCKQEKLVESAGILHRTASRGKALAPGSQRTLDNLSDHLAHQLQCPGN